MPTKKPTKTKAPSARQPTTKAPNKTKKVIALMQRTSGVTRDQVLEVTGWPSISMQSVAEKANLKLKMEKVEGKPTVYRAST